MKRFLAAVIPIAASLSLCASTAVGVAHSSRVSAGKTVTLRATLSGRTEVPTAGARAGRGTAVIRINLTTDKLCYTLRVSGFKLPALAAHIHAGGPGKSGPILVPFPTAPGRTGSASACTTVKASVLTRISGHPSSYYVNVHTAQYPGGAVRGQLGM